MIEQHYEITSISPIEPPADAQSSEWHSYTITQGKNTIRGYREGSLRSVTRAAELIVEQLNERRAGKRSRAQIVIATTKKS